MKRLPVILHIPHWSTVIPANFRDGISLSNEELQNEILKMTDFHTELSAAGNWAEFVMAAEVSRLVCDVERFRDDVLDIHSFSSPFSLA